MPDRFAATEMTYTGISSDSSYGLFMSSPSSSQSILVNSVLLGSAEQLRPRVCPGGGYPQVLKRRTGLAVQVVRHGHLDRCEQRAEVAVLAADTAARNAEHLSVRSTRWDADGDRRTAVRGHPDLRPERELGHRHRHRDGEVIARPAEHRVRFHVNPDVQITVLAAVLARSALAGDPDPLAIRDARRDPRLDGLRAHGTAAAAAGRAGIVDHEPAAPAGLARLGESEAAQVPALLTGTLAVRADPRHRAGLGAGAVADRARALTGQSQRHGGAVDRIAERQRGLRLHVRAAPGPALRGAAAAEDPGEDVAEPVAGLARAAEQVAQVEPAEPAAAPAWGRHSEHRACFVVLLALLLIRQHVVRLGDLLEALFGVGVPLVRVGMVLPREVAVRLLYLSWLRGLGHAQSLVVILLQVILRAHLASLGSLVSLFTGFPLGGVGGSVRSCGGLCNRHPGRVENPLAHLVARLEDLHAGVLRDIRRVAVGQRLVDLRIERVAALAVTDQSELVERRLQRVRDGLESAGQLAVFARLADGVERGQQLGERARHRVLAHRGPVSVHPLAVVGVLCLESLQVCGALRKLLAQFLRGGHLGLLGFGQLRL